MAKHANKKRKPAPTTHTTTTKPSNNIKRLTKGSDSETVRVVPAKKKQQKRLYTHHSQHLRIDEPNIILINKHSRFKNVIEYIFQRLVAPAPLSSSAECMSSADGDAESTPITTTTSTTLGSETNQTRPAKDNDSGKDKDDDAGHHVNSVVLLAANSAIQPTVTMLEVIKRRLPASYSAIEIGTINNQEKYDQLEQSQETELVPQQLYRNTKQQQTDAVHVSTVSGESSLPVPQDNVSPQNIHAPIAYAMKIVILNPV